MLDKADSSSAFLVELEFMNFQTPSQDGYTNCGDTPNMAAYLEKHSPKSMRTLTSGMFGYSLTRPTANKKYFHEIFNQSVKFRTDIEGWHSESGPGVFEAVSLLSLGSRRRRTS